MAVLEKIRKRSVLLFIIIIGALLAFILGDFLNSGRSLFGPGDTVAKVGGAKVSQMDLNKKSEQLENSLKQARAAGQDVPAEYADPDYRYGQSVEAALYEKLMNQECERLGIQVTDEFISKFVANPQSAGYVWQTLMGELGGNAQETMMYLQQNGIVDPTTYLDAIKNPARYHLDGQITGALQQAWKNMETSLAQNVEFSLYNQMLGSMMQPNKADAKAYFENQNNLAAVKAVSVPLSTVKDSEITLEESDYQAAYDKNKEAFRLLDESREVAFIVIPIEPSDDDYAKAEKEAAALRAELSLSEGIEAVLDHKGFNQQTLTLTDADLQRNLQYASLRMDSTGVSKGSVHELFAPRGTKSIAKILDVTSGIDRVVFDFYPLESAAQADSVFTDKSFAAVDSVISTMTGGQLADLSTSLINPSAELAGLISNAAVKDALANAPLKEYYAINDSINGQPFNAVVLVKERDAEVPAYQLAVMTYEVYPSEKTRQDLAQALHNYVANHPTAEKFANDTTGTYNVMYSMISPNSYTIANPSVTPGTRTVVKWAMDAKNGAVSPVFQKQKTIYGRNGQPDETQDYLIAVAVMDIYDDYVPANSHLVKESLKNRAMADKKAKVLVDKYNGKGKNADEYAKAMGATPQDMNVAFGAGTIGGQAQGALAAAKKGAVVGPVQGNTAVYVFQVDEVTTPDFNAADLKTRLREAAPSFRTPQAGLQMLIGNRKVTNNTLLFTVDEAGQ